MQRLLKSLVGCSLALVATAAVAEFHFYQIDEIFSNASGNVRYV